MPHQCNEFNGIGSAQPSSSSNLTGVERTFRCVPYAAHWTTAAATACPCSKRTPWDAVRPHVRPLTHVEVLRIALYHQCPSAI